MLPSVPPLLRCRRLAGVLFLLLPAVPSALLAGACSYLDSDSPASRQAAGMLARMTLEEKAGQMMQVDSSAPGAARDVAALGLGSVLSGGGSNPEAGNSPEAWANYASTFKNEALRTRLRIPLLYGIDAVHGHNNVAGAVIFPQNIGLGATRNPALVERAARVTAEEMAATGIFWDFAPCVAVTRDERWGRTYESFGESSELVAEMGAACVRGLQGERLSAPTSVLACAKHFAADGGTWRGKDQGNARITEAELRRIHFPGYEAAIQAGVGSIMVSYSSWNGVKMHGNRHLLTDVLKGELGFRGFLVSDWAAIDQLPGNYRSDIREAINAGLDMIMLPSGLGKKNNYRDFQKYLLALVRSGEIPMSRINDAVRRILTVKYAMALGKRPDTPSKEALSRVGSANHRAVARQCVRESLVLLKNTGALPLRKTGGKILVAGRAANDLSRQCGGWTIDWQGTQADQIRGGTTILDGIRNAAGNRAVDYSPVGKRLPKDAEVAVVVIGESPYAEFFGDQSNLRLNRVERITIERCRKAGLPVVLVIVSGRPLIMTKELAECSAAVAAWLPGTEGAGVSDVLFGDYAPVGKLPISWPRSMRQIPVNAGDANYQPLFPYGFGLSYR